MAIPIEYSDNMGEMMLDTIEAEMSIPNEDDITVIDESFDHEFGTHRQYSHEYYGDHGVDIEFSISRNLTIDEVYALGPGLADYIDAVRDFEIAVVEWTWHPGRQILKVVLGWDLREGYGV